MLPSLTSRAEPLTTPNPKPSLTPLQAGNRVGFQLVAWVNECLECQLWTLKSLVKLLSVPQWDAPSEEPAQFSRCVQMCSLASGLPNVAPVWHQGPSQIWSGGSCLTPSPPPSQPWLLPEPLG